MTEQSAPTQDGLVSADQQQADLKRTSATGLLKNVGSQIVLFLIRFGYQIVIAHLLIPSEFGLVAMTAPVIAFVQLFSDLGLSQAAIQKQDITQQEMSFLFWLNVAAGLALAALCAIGAPLVAAFYHDDRVRGIVLVSGLLLLLSSLYSQHMTLLRRRLQFGSIAVINVISFTIGSVVGVVSALLGAGYWSLLLNQGAATLTSLVLTWAIAAWLPGYPGRIDSIKEFLHFGSNVTAFNLVNFFSRNSDNILLGRFAGEYALGLYDRAYKLMLLPFTQVSAPFSAVAVPLLSRTQDQPEFYRRAYKRMIEAVLLLVYPGLIFMVIDSRELIEFVLGERWTHVAPIFAILGIDAFVAPIGSSMGWLFVSQARTREMRDYGIIASLIFVSCFVAGLHWGAVGVASGYSLAGVIEISFLWRIGTRRGPLRRQDLVMALKPFVLPTLTSIAVMFLGRYLVKLNWVGLTSQACLTYVVFLAALALQPSGRDILVFVWQRSRELLIRKGSVSASLGVG